jgi:probable rRNA maturation factor
MPDGDPTRSLVVIVTDESARPRARRLPGLAAWLQSVAPLRARGVVSLALVADRTIRRLNREYAGKDMVTDVLSFPAAGPRVGVPLLGDIVIATGVARRQAREVGHAFSEEVKTLALHGLLHLLGYDHHADAGTMARVEARLRRKGGLREGLIERARRG